MTEGYTMGVEREEYVEVMHDYSYQRDDRTLHMTKGEILMLLKRSTTDWWQVIRQGEQRPFFAPVQYIRVTAIPHEQMKQFIKQGRQQYKPQQKQSSDEDAPIGRPQVLPLQQMDNKCTSAVGETLSPPNPVPSQSYVAKIEPNRGALERKDQYPYRLQGFSSFKSDAVKGLPPRSSINELPSPSSRTCTQGGHESSSSHTSKSSLNDGSLESLKYLHSRKQVMKAASHDELTCGERSHSTLDISQPRAASSEELDGHYSGRDYLFKSNQLSHRHRSNSVDFRIFQKELSFSEMKQGSLDKVRKPRLSKDPGNRRRSWAVEELRASDNLRPSLKRGETVDAAIVLDVPPKLPPKQRKHRLDNFTASSENLGKLEGPIDIKLQEVKLRKSMASSATPGNSLSKNSEKGHSRHASDPLILSENEKSSLGRQDAQDLKDPPVALPRKILPPPVTPIENKQEDNEGTSGNKVGMSTSASTGISDSLPRDANGNQVQKSSSHSSLNNSSVIKDGGILKRGGSLSQGSHGQKFCVSPESVHKVPGTPDSLRKAGGTPTSTRKDYGTPESLRKAHGSSGKVSGLRETWRSFKQKGEKRESKKEEEKVNEEGGRMSARETPTPDSSRSGKIIQTPPSPQTSPQRIVFDDWGEYIDEATRRPYYYNTRTHEKRWKPPRKGIHSVAIPEVPPYAKHEELKVTSSRGPPRSPAPDYPNSPKSSHKPFSYANMPEGTFSSSLNRAATLNPASTISQHHPVASSLTLPAYGVSPNKTIPSHHSIHYPLVSSLNLVTPPLVPPSSAKPQFPATPTTPNSTEFPELSEADQNSALLDILYDMNPPKGWCKKIDALTQRVYFYNVATGQRPKGVTWVTELDIAHHDNKQYIRKSYQSTMDLDKEMQLDADIFDDTNHLSEGSQRDDDTSLNRLLASNSKILGHMPKPNVTHDPKIPPKKPPRKSQLSVQPSVPLQSKQTEVVTISSRPRSPGVQTRCILTPPDTPSIMEPGFRLSSFAPRTNTSNKPGHSRSKSESVKVDELKLLDISFQDPSIAFALGGMVAYPKSPSAHSTSPKSPSPGSISPKSPSTRSVSPKSPSTRSVSPKSPSPYVKKHKSPSRQVLNPESPLPSTLQKTKSHATIKSQKTFVKAEASTKQEVLSKTLISPGSCAQKYDKPTSLCHLANAPPYSMEKDQRQKQMETDNPNSLPRDLYSEILKELSIHNVMSSQLSKENKNIQGTGDLHTTIEYKKQGSESAASCIRSEGEHVLQKTKQKDVFNFSNYSQHNQSLKISTFSEGVGRRPRSNYPPKSLNNVRKSTFISHDEIGSILEDKSLSYLSRTTPPEEKTFHGGPGVDPVSPQYKSYDQGSENQSDVDESALIDDNEGFSPTMPSQYIESDQGRERRKSQDSEKWLATNNDEGKIYYYEESGSKSLWRLPQIDDYDDASVDGKGTTSPPENLRISRIVENLQEYTVKEGFLYRTFLLREGKKVRKNWTQSYARYLMANFDKGYNGLLYFSKTKDEDKKAEEFEFYPTCHLEHTTDKKTSRQQVLGLRNGLETEVLLQFDDKSITDEWFKVLLAHDGMQYTAPTTEKEEKKGKRGSEKIKREASVEHLSPDSKGITDKLRNFIKRRPLKETLEKKGIYKESVFGSTLAELRVQDKTAIPIFVLQCINHIEKTQENLRTDGLYRISGNAAQIQKIRFEVAQRNYTILSREKEIHNLSGALKLFFRELKEPLIPFDNYQDFIQATGSEYRKMNQQADKLTKAVNKLPQENYDTLKLLLQHLLSTHQMLCGAKNSATHQLESKSDVTTATPPIRGTVHRES
ncbi:uncharacterized protein LOC121863788 isoform X2 [Homarus americanus]|uniref:uncharacterized protein LOC121863788 isoform X2 n=1 Tax=Homarus americanus TaxID=6706 RepID=UPI001C44138D|nr:uncharacterized protein LOC121863788 isoform X2 [Homarus americanus]